MRALVRTIRRFLTSKYDKELHSLAVTELPLADSLLPPWSSDEVSIALRCEQHKPMCTVRSLTDGDAYQTILLGLDLDNNLLLLDDFFPKITLIKRFAPMQIILIGDAGILALTIIPEESFELNSKPAMLVRITNKLCLSDRRIHQRTSFQEHFSPKVTLLVPMSGELKGNLQNISCGGLMMRCHASNKLEFHASTGECLLEFNEAFTLNVRVKIKTVKFFRKPYRHSFIRLIFTDLNSHQQDQIQLFINSHINESKQRAA